SENQYISNFDKKDIIFQKASPFGLVTVRKNGENDSRFDRTLSIDDRDQCTLNGNETERLIADGALAYLPTGRKVLSIGLGCSFTLERILDYQPSQVTVAEINPVVAEAAKYFQTLTDGAIYDDRVKINIIDGAELLRTTSEKYDTIIIDIENPTVAHSSLLYTVEYLRYAKEHLNEGGRVALWGYNSVDQRYLKSLVATFEEVFDNVIFSHDGIYLFVASDSELDSSIIDRNNVYDKLKKDLESIDMVPPNTIDQPTLEAYYRLS
ncbi:spermidine synthase, partial [Patescibacteria group bacterium]